MSFLRSWRLSRKTSSLLQAIKAGKILRPNFARLIDESKSLNKPSLLSSLAAHGMILAHPVPSIQNQSATLKEKVKSIIWCNQLGIAFGRIYRQGDWRIYVLVEISLDCNNSGKVDRRRIVADTRTDFDALRVIHESCASWRCVAMTRHKVSNRKLRATLIIMIAKFGSANKHENFYFSLGLMLCISNRFLCFYLAIENEGKYL